MIKRSFLPVFLLFLITLTAVISAYGQDIDVSSMDNEQLTVLLQEILSKLDQKGSEKSETAVQTGVSEDPAETAMPKFSIWKNKKLIMEALPSYMFVQKATEEPDTTNDPGKKKDNTDNHYNGEPCTSDGGTWYYYNGEWNCGYG